MLTVLVFKLHKSVYSFLVGQQTSKAQFYIYFTYYIRKYKTKYNFYRISIGLLISTQVIRTFPYSKKTNERFWRLVIDQIIWNKAKFKTDEAKFYCLTTKFKFQLVLRKMNLCTCRNITNVWTSKCGKCKTCFIEPLG